MNDNNCTMFDRKARLSNAAAGPASILSAGLLVVAATLRKLCVCVTLRGVYSPPPCVSICNATTTTTTTTTMMMNKTMTAAISYNGAAASNVGHMLAETMLLTTRPCTHNTLS